MIRLAGRVLLIAGAAGSLGSAVAEAADRAGARLALVDRDADRLGQVVGDGADVLRVGGTDLGQRHVARDVVAAVVDRFGRLDAVVTTIGGFHVGPGIAEEGWAPFETMIDVNLRPTVHLLEAATPRLAAPGGRIVTIGARPALSAPAGMAAYAAAKSAVVRLTEALAAEQAERGITANCVLPSIIDTPANRAAMPDADCSRWVTPEALADVILFLVSDLSRAISGAAIPVYGRA
jgi:NAD(P)-dependent dehydrogenase (short-subunit alcohol dehydrogenase family)